MAVTVPSGFRFKPTDLELVRDYLLKKLTNQPLPSDDSVTEYDVFNTVPWNLPENNIDNSRFYSKKINKTSYYFVPREKNDDMSLCNGNRVKHMVKCRDGTSKSMVGYWKRTRPTPHDKLIRDERKQIVGIKKAFAFHYYYTSNNGNNDNECSNITTGWVMHEYTLNSQKFQPLVLCSVRNKFQFNISFEYDDKNNYINNSPQLIDLDEAERMKVASVYGNFARFEYSNTYIKIIDSPQPIDPDEAERMNEMVASVFGNSARFEE